MPHRKPEQSSGSERLRITEVPSSSRTSRRGGFKPSLGLGLEVGTYPEREGQPALVQHVAEMASTAIPGTSLGMRSRIDSLLSESSEDENIRPELPKREPDSLDTLPALRGAEPDRSPSLDRRSTIALPEAPFRKEMPKNLYERREIQDRDTERYATFEDYDEFGGKDDFEKEKRLNEVTRGIENFEIKKEQRLKEDVKSMIKGLKIIEAAKRRLEKKEEEIRKRLEEAKRILQRREKKRERVMKQLEAAASAISLESSSSVGGTTDALGLKSGKPVEREGRPRQRDLARVSATIRERESDEAPPIDPHLKEAIRDQNIRNTSLL